MAALAVAVTDAPALMKTFLKYGRGEWFNPKRAFPDLPRGLWAGRAPRDRGGHAPYRNGLACVNQKVISAQGLILSPGGERPWCLAQDKSFLHSWFVENPIWCSPSTGSAVPDSFPGPATKFPWEGHSASPVRRLGGCLLNHQPPRRARDPGKQPLAPGSPSEAGQPCAPQGEEPEPQRSPQPRRKGAPRPPPHSYAHPSPSWGDRAAPCPGLPFPEQGVGCGAFWGTLRPGNLCLCSRWPAGIPEKGSQCVICRVGRFVDPKYALDDTPLAIHTNCMVLKLCDATPVTSSESKTQPVLCVTCDSLTWESHSNSAWRREGSRVTF